MGRAEIQVDRGEGGRGETDRHTGREGAETDIQDERWGGGGGG